MARRFYLPQPLGTGPLRLAGREAHHLLHVLRMSIGDQVRIFDGQGQEALAQIESLSADEALLRVLERYASASELPTPLILATAVPKGERFRWLVEKATELGVTKLIPLNTSRSIVDPGAGKLGKLRQTVVEASKQCGRSQLMEIAEPVDWRKLVASEFAGRTVLVAHPSGEAFELRPDLPRQPILVAIGPEGGLTDEEVELAVSAGATPVTLGPRILRIETAGVVAAVLVGGWCERMASRTESS